MARLFILLLTFMLSQGGAATRSKVIESREKLTITSIDKATYTVFKKVLVADERGRQLAEMSIGTGDFRTLKSARARVYNEQGKLKKKYKTKHLTRIDPVSYGIIATDNVVHRLSLKQSIPIPFIVEMEYTVEYKSLFMWPSWYPQESIPVEKAVLDLFIPEGYQFTDFSPGGVEKQQMSATHYHWELEDLPSYPEEERTPVEGYHTYIVMFSPHDFSLAGYTGSQESWQDFGSFYRKLAREQYDLNPASITDLDLKGATTRRDTIRDIYEYVQQTTRYVGMELGVHGWKPHSSQWVCDNKYGDCKDLATFFISILKLYDIPAYPVLIYTRDRGYVYPEFPTSEFNHAIACVPLGGDTLWVDCTVDNGRIDIIPSRNQGCNVLLIKADTTLMIQTPVQSPEFNHHNFDAQIQLNASGSAQMQATISWDGYAAIDHRRFLKRKTLEKQREYIIDLFDRSAPGLELDSLRIEHLQDKYEPLKIMIEAHIPHLATKTGKRLFLKPGLPYSMGWRGEHPSRRKTSYFARSPALFTRNIEIHFHESLEVEGFPEDMDFESQYGHIKQSYGIEDQSIRYQFKYSEEKTLIPQDEYQPYYDFRLKVKKTNAAPMVFRKR